MKAKHVGVAFDGEGARRFGGRWNSKGTPMVYTAGSQALAVLELLVHLEESDVLKHYCLIPVQVDESMVKKVDIKSLPANWNRRPTSTHVRAIGDAWVAAYESVALQVPSAIVSGESNYLLNPLHDNFAKLVIGKPQPFRFDPRLK